MVMRAGAWGACWFIVFFVVLMTELAVCMNGWSGPLVVFAASWGSVALLGMMFLARRRRPRPVPILAAILTLGALMGAVAAMTRAQPRHERWRAPSFHAPGFDGQARLVRNPEPDTS